MTIYLPSMLDKFKDFVNGIKANWQEYEAHVNATAEDDVHGLAGAVIVDAGSNDNGSWVRFGNGLQICWHRARNWPESVPDTAAGSLYRSSADLVWTYPKPFVDEPCVDGSSSGHSWVTDAGGASRDNTESYSFRVYRYMAAAVNPHIRLWAIGRWK